VLAVIEADPEDVGGDQGGQEFLDLEFFGGGLELEEVRAVEPLGAPGVERLAEVDLAGGLEADDAHRRNVEAARGNVNGSSPARTVILKEFQRLKDLAANHAARPSQQDPS